MYNKQLKDLCGKHILQGIEWQSVENNELNAIAFKLDGIVYLAIEDEADGWRSYCKELKTSNKDVRFHIPDTEVMCSMMKNTFSETNDVLVITDINTGKIVLEVGTKNCDDYYPYCHFEYHPENLVWNKGL